jgi:hypothetical protein
MFTEIPNVRQIKGEPKRRWFYDADLELIVWFGRWNTIVGFQLCYQADRKPKALTWHEHDGYLHSGIDDGEGRPGRHKATPILVPDGAFDKDTIGERFVRSSGSLPRKITDFVRTKIAEYET